jgi:glutathione peroxidase
MSLYDVEVRTITGEAKSLRDFADKTLLVVNVASKCGFTPQYKGLEELHQRYKDRGLVVLGFPCDQFGHQEPGDEAEIQRFCSLTYDVSFPMFAKVEVNGGNAHPLFVALKKAAPGLLGTQAIKWNFTKFLISPDGRTIKRFGPRDEPASLASDIERALPRGA